MSVDASRTITFTVPANIGSESWYPINAMTLEALESDINLLEMGRNSEDVAERARRVLRRIRGEHLRPPMARKRAARGDEGE